MEDLYLNKLQKYLPVNNLINDSTGVTFSVFVLSFERWKKVKINAKLLTD